MLFHSVSEVNFIFAEDSPTASSAADGEQKRRRRRVRSKVNTSETKVASQSVSNAAKLDSTQTSKKVTKVDEEGRKFLTTLGSEDIFGNEAGRAKSKKAYSDLAKQKIYTMMI